MGQVKDTAADVYRDFQVAGVPASGTNDPAKRDIRTLFSAIDLAIGTAQAGITILPTTTARDTFYATEANRGKLVYVNNNNGSATDPANGVYEYVGGAPRIAQSFYEGVATVVQPLVDRAETAATSATSAADRVLFDYALAVEDVTSDATFEIVPASGATARGTRGLTYSPTASGSGATIRSTIRRRPYMKDGETYLFVFEATTSDPFTRPITGAIVAFPAAGDPRPPAGVSSVVTIAGRIAVTVAYTIQSGDRDFMLQAVTGYRAETGATEWIEVSDFKIRSDDADDTIARVITNRLADYAPAVLGDNRMAQARTLIDTAGGAQVAGYYGQRFPAGSSGKDAVFQVTHRVDGAAKAGRRQRLIVAFRTTTGFTRSFGASLFVERSDASGGQAATDPVIKGPYKTPDGWMVTDFECTLTATTTSLVPTFQQINAAAPSATESMALAGVYPSMDTPVPGWTTSSEVLAEMVTRGPTPRVVFASDFASLQAASDSITDATAASPVTILLGEGVYSLTQQYVKPAFVNLQGLGKARTTIRLFQANNATAQQIIANSVVDFRSDGWIADLSIEGKNCQYGIHWDTTGQIFDLETTLRRVRVTHFGNLEATNGTAWSAQNAIGGGASGGQLMRAEECEFYAVNGYAFSVHNNLNARSPCRVELIGCTFESEVEGDLALLIISIGSRQADSIVVTDCVIGGKVSHSIQGWVPADQPDNRTEWDMTFSGCSPFVFTNDDPGATGSRVRPLVTNEEVRALNKTGAAIPAGTVCTYSGATRVRLMTSADPAATPVLVALAPVAVGASGRFKKGGYLPLGNLSNAISGSSDILRTDTAAFAFGDTFGIDPASPGKIKKGATPAVFAAIRPDAVRFLAS